MVKDGSNGPHKKRIKIKFQDHDPHKMNHDLRIRSESESDRYKDLVVDTDFSHYCLVTSFLDFFLNV